MKTLYKACLYGGLGCLVAIVAVLLARTSALILAPLVIVMFVLLALGVRGADTIFKSFSFLIWIFVSVSWLCFTPHLLSTWEVFRPAD